jgi:hypothetical protein
MIKLFQNTEINFEEYLDDIHSNIFDKFFFQCDMDNSIDIELF